LRSGLSPRFGQESRPDPPLLETRVAKFAAEFDSTLIYRCDVAENADIDALFAALAEHWDGLLEGLVHSIAYAPGEAIKGDFLDGISAGPIKTLAASGIGNFSRLLAYNAHNAPLRRNITIDEVGNATAFMLSDLAGAITGEIMYVDGGLNTTALGNAEPMPGREHAP
jgi:enoyl-[acyl-carrier-protein] reductase (NADH)